MKFDLQKIEFILDIIYKICKNMISFLKKEVRILKKSIKGVCPVCGGEMYITQLKCEICGTTISGEFELNEFSRLSEDQLEFLREFIKSRGNLSEVQKKFNISYPTAKARLEEIIRTLGYEVEREDTIRARTMEILEKIEKGELSPEEARVYLSRLREERR